MLGLMERELVPASARKLARPASWCELLAASGVNRDSALSNSSKVSVGGRGLPFTSKTIAAKTRANIDCFQDKVSRIMIEELEL